MKFFSWISKGIQSIFSGRGKLSAKRVTGVWLILLVSFCIVWIMIHEGGTNVVENLLETSLIIAASLLGLSSVTGIFKENHKIDAKNKMLEQGSETEGESEPQEME